MAAMKLTDNLASLSVQSGKQRGGAIAPVIMRAAFCLTGTHGQNRLRAIQCLNLRFLVHTQNQGFFRWIKIKSHNIAHLLDKQRVLRKLKGLTAMRGQRKSAPHTMDAGVTQTGSLG